MTSFKLAPANAFEPLAFSLRRSRKDLVGVACIDRRGCLGPCEFFRRPQGHDTLTAWGPFARQFEAAAVVVAFRARPDGYCASEDDAQFIKKTSDLGMEIGIPVWAFLVVDDACVRIITRPLEMPSTESLESDYAVARKIS